jgi:hypothetical protein
LILTPPEVSGLSKGEGAETGLKQYLFLYKYHGLVLLCVSDGSGALFMSGFYQPLIKKRERTARPEVFTEGDAQIILN